MYFDGLVRFVLFSFLVVAGLFVLFSFLFDFIFSLLLMVHFLAFLDCLVLDFGFV